MTGPGSDDESDDHRDERDDPRHDTDRAGADDAPEGGGHEGDRHESDGYESDEHESDGYESDEHEGDGHESDGRDAPVDDRNDAPVDEATARPDHERDDTEPQRAAADTRPTAPDSAEASPVEPGGRPDGDSDRDTGPTSETDGPPIPGDTEQDDEGFDGPIDWFLHTNDTFVVTVRDIGSSLLTVAFIGIVLFAVSGIWPPLVAVESGSMEPHMHRNDLVFIVEDGRFVGDSAQAGTGVVTHRTAQQNDGYWSFGNYGNVIVYQPNDDPRRVPIIHRASFWVEEGENWVDPPSEGGTGKANPQYLARGDTADRDFDCDDIAACRPDHSGFVTKGDNNEVYDQVGGQSNVVRPDWIRGKAKVRIPLLGWIRLQFAQLATTFGSAGPSSLAALRLQLGVVFAGAGTVVARRRGVL